MEPGQILALVGTIATALGGLIGSVFGHRRGQAEERAKAKIAEAEADKIASVTGDDHWQRVIAQYAALLTGSHEEVRRLRERVDRLEEAIDRWQQMHARAEMDAVEAEAKHRVEIEQLRAQLRAIAAERRSDPAPTGDLSGPTPAPDRDLPKRR